MLKRSLRGSQDIGIMAQGYEGHTDVLRKKTEQITNLDAESEFFNLKTAERMMQIIEMYLHHPLNVMRYYRIKNSFLTIINTVVTMIPSMKEVEARFNGPNEYGPCNRTRDLIALDWQ